MLNELELDTALINLKTDMVKFKYVFNRSEGLSISDSANKSGRNRQWYYSLSKDEQAHLEELAQDLSAYSTKKIKIIFDENKVKAANKIVKLVDSRNEKIALDAAKEVLDRPAGKAEEPTNTLPAISIPAELLAPDFFASHRAILSGDYSEYLEYGGRGSTKSTFFGLEIPALLINDPTAHALAMRQVKGTLRESVYAQIEWGINHLGLSDSFKCTTNPLEMTYLPTGQKILFRGADDPAKIKSIKLPFGAIKILWFEELPEFRGLEGIRSITQSAIRGTDKAYIFKSWNPPRTSGNWVNKYLTYPKEKQWRHQSDYRSVPADWLGKVFIEEAEYLKSVNPDAYDHEYLGVVNGLGDQIFNNINIRPISDDEIAQFDNVLHGLDFGFYPHPAHYAKVHYDPKNLTLYIFGEVRKWKTSNRDLYAALVEYGLSSEYLLVCDSAEPKSVSDFREYGAYAIGAEKGEGSVSYSMKWLQSLKSIVIDSVRAPYTAEEFTDYAYERTNDGEIIESYPREKDDAIAAVRYATNLIWRRRGK
jgi:phage terminase large subunit